MRVQGHKHLRKMPRHQGLFLKGRQSPGNIVARVGPLPVPAPILALPLNQSAKSRGKVGIELLARFAVEKGTVSIRVIDPNQCLKNMRTRATLFVKVTVNKFADQLRESRALAEAAYPFFFAAGGTWHTQAPSRQAPSGRS